MVRLLSEWFLFEEPGDAELPKRKWHLNARIGFALLITLATTLWFLAFNRNLAGGSVRMSHLEWLGVTAAMYGLSLVPLLLVLLIEKTVFKSKILPMLGLKPTPGAVTDKLKYIVLIFAVALAVFWARFALHMGGQITWIAFLYQIPENMLVAFCEELVFRGYIQSAMTQKWGDVPGVLATAALFLVVHLPVRILLQYRGPAQLAFSLAFTLVGGVVFGFCARKDRCIYGSAALHFSMNLCHYMVLL